MNTYINVNAIEDGSIPVSKIAGNIGSGSTDGVIAAIGCLKVKDQNAEGSFIGGTLNIGSSTQQTNYTLKVNGTSHFTGSLQCISNIEMFNNGTGADTPSILFRRGTLTDTYNDWDILNTSGQLMFRTRYNDSIYPMLTFSAATSTNIGTISTPGRINAALGFFETSDERKKDFAEPIDVDFEKLKMLKKNYFFWKDSDNKDRQIGVSAQDIQTVYPELVTSDSNGELSVDYAKLSVIALKAVDTLYDKNTELEKRITNLEKVVDVLLTRVC